MTRRTRLSIAVAAVLLLAAVIVVVIALLATTTPTPAPLRATAGQSAAVSARGACTDMADVEQLTRQNAAARKVLRYVAAAVQESTAAVTRDSTWRSLQSGVVAIQQSLEDNSAGLASTGIAIVRAQCRRTDLPAHQRRMLNA